MIQYANDTILILEANKVDALNLKYFLCCFEHLSGLKVNFHKSEIICFWEAKSSSGIFVDIFLCVEGVLPMRYLGIPAHNIIFRNSDWKNVEEKMEKNLAHGKDVFFLMEENQH